MSSGSASFEAQAYRHGVPMFPMRMGGIDPGPGGLRYALKAVLVFAVCAIAFWFLVSLL